MNEIKCTISGLRGIWGENFTETVAEKYLTAYALYLQKRGARKIVLGRDARISGPIIFEIAKKIITDAGIDIIDVGIVPTPTVIFLIRHLQLDGGIMVSASHNPKEYNGIKFLTNKALYANQEEINEIKSYIDKPLEKIDVTGVYCRDTDIAKEHVSHILKFVDVEKIRARNFRVVLDPINSSGFALGPHLLEELGCTPIVINGMPNGIFAHTPEPLPENLTGLAAKVKLFQAHVGFAMDPDADRLVVCDEKGVVIFEEYTLSLAIKAVLEKTPTDIVINLSTSNTNEDLALAIEKKTYRTPVGEMHVVQGMQDHHAQIGGEGGGGVIHKEMNLCRDSLVGIALILQALAETTQTTSELVESLPKWEFIKTKFPFSGNFELLKEKTISLFPDASCNKQDGLRFDFPNRSWVQIRASNTEPLIRIFTEGKDREELEEKIEKIKNIL